MTRTKRPACVRSTPHGWWSSEYGRIRWVPLVGDFTPPPGGVLLPSAPFAPAANAVFSPEELEERIAAHRRRVFRECPPLERRGWACADDEEE